MITYRYVGNGLGVPGLPHEISDEEARQRGLLELLQQAVQSGMYQAEGGTVSVETGDELPVARRAPRKVKE